MRKNFFSIVLMALGIFGLILTGPGQALSETFELRFAHPYSSNHPEHKGALVPWAERIEKETNGRVEIKFITGGALGKPGQVYDVVAKGVADIGWDICDYSPGKFPLTTVIELPFMVETAEEASVTIWKAYEKFPAFQKEYEDTKLLMLSPHPPGFFATMDTPIRTLDDLKGLKIKTASSFTTEALKIFGSVPVTQPVTETYTSLERGVVDGVVSPFSGIVTFNLHELLNYYTPANFYSLVFWMAMNKSTFNSLPQDIQKVIEDNSGLTLSRLHGKSFDKTRAATKKVAIESGMEKIEFPESERKKLVELTEPLKQEWIEDMEKKGLPGKEVFEYVNKLRGE
ncbi:MAG: TRAP transporter substrate-binding protein [Desulfobacteraceae bacterium]|nr:TRAP transporter substrate-binding protein [Desulfobacteraceae bacterium]